MEMLLVFQNKDNIGIIGFWSMHFGFALDLSDIHLLNVDLLDQRYTHLDLFFSKTSWRRLQDMSSRRLQDMSSRRLQGMSSRHVLKTSSRRLEDQQMFAGYWHTQLYIKHQLELLANFFFVRLHIQTTIF